MKRVNNTRIQNMINSCINQPHNNDGDNEDFYDNSRPSSPIQFSSDLLGKKKRRSSTDILASKLHEKAAGDGTIPNPDIVSANPDVSNNLLTIFPEQSQCPPSSPQNATILTCDDNVETAAEKSIEAPPYSPLTPRPYITKSLHHGVGQLSETLAEKSVESLSPISPLPLMSPETASLFHILAGSIDTEAMSDTSTIASTRSYQAHLFNDSDDSVRDPDYCANADLVSSDDSSNGSISLITGTTAVEINEIPNQISGIVNRYQLESMNLEPITDHVTANIALPDHETESSLTEKPPVGRPKKGIKPKYGGLSRDDRKKLKYRNISYVNSSKKVVSPKKFVDFQCSCLKKCSEIIPVEKRLALFQKNYCLDSYNAQNMFLAACIKEEPVKRHYITTNKSQVSKTKSYSRQYILDGVVVCREMFVKTLQTSAKRINTSLCKLRSDDCIIDKRGLHGGHNRVTLESTEFVIKFIKSLPTYVSHYCREKSEGSKFLRPDMTLSKIYQLYSDEAKAAGATILSASKVNQIFFTKFNLHTKPLKKDTCNKCDYFQSQLQHASTEETRAEIEQKRKAHQDIANFLQNQLKTDMKTAKDDPSIETLTFDLEKTLPLPRIPTNIVFYKRQLWVYNLGIHCGSNDEAHCNVWVEGEAGRGAQEVASCLIKHISERLDGRVKNLILWCDSCGGQNRNIKLTLMLKAILNGHPTLNQINIRFLESGHSFLPNDTEPVRFF